MGKMMKVLIDTHIFLWFFLEPKKISESLRNFLENTDENKIYLSYVSAWEISIKYGIGKLKIPEKPEIYVPKRLSYAGFLSLPIEIRHVLQVHNLPPIHKDPFDRLLISQAKTENLHILTADPNFAEYRINILDIAKL